MASRQYKWQLKQIAKGRCAACGKKVSKKNKRLCEFHRREHLKWNRQYYKSKLAVDGEGNKE